MKSADSLVCGEKLFKQISVNLKEFEIRSHEKEGATQAAVAVTVVDASYGSGIFGMPVYDQWNDSAALILTRRAPRLKNHAGQWSFPGGHMDPGESPEDTALRELEEEVGLKLDYGRVIGRLDDFTTRSGFTITPVVIWGGPVAELTPDPKEVASIHRIPIEEFLREDAPLLNKIPESKHPVLRMPVGNSWIAAPTAAMIYQFREVAILGRDTRVAHFEQPYFAWV
ncbi:MAG: CoA pyrophosphatase [Deltaproteobacteria bacterium]|nr:CoA pyrophosphatase [Deltaproteobacteria bacterium]MBW2053507.1 CoA pyrophosphatase [Deltaproteobacteria bacterium]MBW2324722.1 CoA pyrophosphatase [Deltaproteobacteria bacterium]